MSNEVYWTQETRQRRESKALENQTKTKLFLPPQLPRQSSLSITQKSELWIWALLSEIPNSRTRKFGKPTIFSWLSKNINPLFPLHSASVFPQALHLESLKFKNSVCHFSVSFYFLSFSLPVCQSQKWWWQWWTKKESGWGICVLGDWELRLQNNLKPLKIKLGRDLKSYLVFPSLISKKFDLGEMKWLIQG